MKLLSRHTGFNKAFLCLLILTGPLFFISCAQKRTQKANQTAMEQPTKIELSIGEKYQLKLPGLGSVGYVWRYTATDNENKTVTVDTSVANIKPPEGQNPGTRSAEEIFTITANSPGHTSIYFYQIRPWEKESKPYKEHRLEVTVKGKQ